MSPLELDPQIEAALRAAAPATAPLGTLPLSETRAAYERQAREQFGTVEAVEAVEDADADGVPVRIYRPYATSDPSTALVYFHGGGWVIGSLDTHDGLVRALARRAGCVVISVDYRLAPEHRYPAALEDAWTAARWVHEQADALGLDPDRIGVGGDSAGGTLATVVARMGRDHALPFAAQLLLYPVATTRTEAPSWELFADGYGLTAEAMRWYFNQYLGSSDGHADPDISPAALLDMRRLPRAIVVTAEADILRDDAETYAQRLQLSGIETEGYRYEGMVHGFLRMAGVVDRAREALDEIGDALAAALAKGWREDFGPAPGAAAP